MVMPSDHVIKDKLGFVDAVRRAANVAATGKLVLLGITPKTPHTGYGYIRRGAPIDGVEGAFAVEAFAEKPDSQTAASLLTAGDYYWNSGIFVLGARAFLQEMDRLEPNILDATRKALARATEDLGFLRLDAESFAKSPNISVDYSVLERTSLAAVVPVDIGWSDMAPGRRYGNSARRTGKATWCKAMRCSRAQPIAISRARSRWWRPSASVT